MDPVLDRPMAADGRPDALGGGRQVEVGASLHAGGPGGAPVRLDQRHAAQVWPGPRQVQPGEPARARRTARVRSLSSIHLLRGVRSGAVDAAVDRA
jgi:hypothetical protein